MGLTNAAKEYEAIKEHLFRKSYYSFLTMDREYVEYHLEQSLELDGRFYGAEWMEELQNNLYWIILHERGKGL